MPQTDYSETNIDYMTIGNQIKKARLNKKLTQEQVADAINISYGYISNIENGKSRVGLQTLIKLSKFLKVSMDMLLKENLALNRLKVIESEISLLLSDMSEADRLIILDLIRSFKTSTDKYKKQ